MKQGQIIKIFKETESLLHGHFCLSSGLHSNGYMQCARVLQYPKYAEAFGKGIAGFFKNKKIETVVAPAMGGIIIGYEVARALNAKSLFTERKDGKMSLRRGFTVDKGEKILVIEDVITTGGSAKEVVLLLLDMGCEVVGVGSIIDRSAGPVDFPVEFRPLAKIDLDVYEPGVCPLCKQGIVIDKPGSKYY